MEKNINSGIKHRQWKNEIVKKKTVNKIMEIVK